MPDTVVVKAFRNAAGQVVAMDSNGSWKVYDPRTQKFGQYAKGPVTQVAASAPSGTDPRVPPAVVPPPSPAVDPAEVKRLQEELTKTKETLRTTGAEKATVEQKRDENAARITELEGKLGAATAASVLATPAAAAAPSPPSPPLAATAQAATSPRKKLTRGALILYAAALVGILSVGAWVGVDGYQYFFVQASTQQVAVAGPPVQTPDGQPAILSLQTRVTALEGDVKQVKEGVNTFNKRFDTIDAGITAMTTQLVTLKDPLRDWANNTPSQRRNIIQTACNGKAKWDDVDAQSVQGALAGYSVDKARTIISTCDVSGLVTDAQAFKPADEEQKTPDTNAKQEVPVVPPHKKMDKYLAALPVAPQSTRNPCLRGYMQNPSDPTECISVNSLR